MPVRGGEGGCGSGGWWCERGCGDGRGRGLSGGVITVVAAGGVGAGMSGGAWCGEGDHGSGSWWCGGGDWPQRSAEWLAVWGRAVRDGAFGACRG